MALGGAGYAPVKPKASTGVAQKPTKKVIKDPVTGELKVVDVNETPKIINRPAQPATRAPFMGAGNATTNTPRPPYQGAGQPTTNTRPPFMAAGNPATNAVASPVTAATPPGYDAGFYAAQAANAGAGGGGTGTGSEGTLGNDPLTGFAARFSEAMLPYVYAQPEILVNELLKSQGMNGLGNNSGLLTALTPYADQLSALMPLAFGGQGQPSTSAPINWLADTLGAAMKPGGGGGVSFGGVMDQLMAATKDPESAAAQYLMAPGMDPIDQFNKTKELVSAASGLGLAPQFQQAMRNAMNSAFLRYMDGFTSGDATGNFLPFFLNKDRGYMTGYR